MSQHIYTYDPVNDQLDEIGGAGHVIKNESGTPFAKRENLQFEGLEVSDDSTNNATIVKAVETNFVGTRAEWQALTLAERAQYKTVDLTDDFNGGPIDSVPTKDSPNPVSSGGVYSSLSNPNLLDNPWFTVNQRGQSSYSDAGYTVDRWKKSSADGLLSVITEGISLSGTSNNAYLQQIIENGFEKLRGKFVTFSILLTDGTLYTASGLVPNTLPSSGTSNIDQVLSDDVFVATSLYLRANGQLFAQVGVKANKSTSIKAVKLELGSLSTLAMDTVPNYATELLKCQRYFQRLGYPNDATYEPLGSGFAKNANLAYIFCPLRAQMRSTPTVTLEGKVYVQDINISLHAGPCTLNSSTARGVHGLILYLVPDTANQFTAGNAMAGYFNQSSNGTPNSYIDISADL